MSFQLHCTDSKPNNKELVERTSVDVWVLSRPKRGRKNECKKQSSGQAGTMAAASRDTDPASVSHVTLAPDQPSLPFLDTFIVSGRSCPPGAYLSRITIGT